MNGSAIAKTEKKINELLPQSPEGMAVTLFVIAMASYYLWRMFAITPNYDELYTYYNFVSRGPLYSAIHWPLPNNHVGYSILSAMLYRCGNSYIALRGVSYVAAIAPESPLLSITGGLAGSPLLDGLLFLGWFSFIVFCLCYGHSEKKPWPQMLVHGIRSHPLAIPFAIVLSFCWQCISYMIG